MRVLIVHAKAGAGHLRAAEAVYGAFKRNGQIDDVMLIDCLDYTTPIFKYLYPRVYMWMVRFAPWLWAFFYYALDLRFIYALIRPFRRFNNALASGLFEKFLKEQNPELIISTQFFASEIISAAKRKKLIDSKLITVVTDFGAHAFWESKEADFFVVGSEDTKADLLRRNIPEEKIRVLGIPIEPPPQQFNITRAYQEMNLREDSFVILIVGGGFGVGPIQEIVTSLNSLKKTQRDKLQLLVVCSRNKKLHAQMDHVAQRAKIDIKIFGFVPDLYKMMLVSDVIISKSGGLTTSESLAVGLPMIIISPIPGQETKNCSLLVKQGAALRINFANQIKGVIEGLIEREGALEVMHHQALMLARPNAAGYIMSLANKLINKKG